MVSRLLSSISGILRSATTSSADIKHDNDESVADNQTTDVAGPRKKGKHAKRKGLEILNAESLDRAIVHRLQSSNNTSINEVDERKVLIKASGLRICDELFENGLDRRISTTETVKVRPSRENSFPETHRSPSRTDSNKPMTLPDIISEEGEILSNSDSFKKFTDHLDTLSANKYSLMEITSGEKRNIMYRNSQFNLENASKETLLSGTKPFEDGDTLFSLPMFGIPDPSMYRRRSPLTSSTESIQGTERAVSNTSLGTEKLNKGRRRSRSQDSKNSRMMPFAGRLSVSQIGEKLFDDTMTDIIEKGGEEFKNKYSARVWDIFHSHLVKMKSLLLGEFNQKLTETVGEREQEINELQKDYREKLAEFDVTTEGFQKMLDSLYKENQRVLKAKDFVIEKLKLEFLECKKHFEQDMLRQMQSFRKEAEIEKLELQKRNDELMRIMLTDASKCGVEDAFKREIESLHKMIKTLTSQNEFLHQQLDEAKNSTSTSNQKTLESLQSQLDHAKVEIMELRKKLQYAECEKDDTTISHNSEIAKLNRKTQESCTRYEHRLREASEEIESLRKRNAKDNKDMKSKLSHQETQHIQIVGQIRQQYGGQVETLSKAVSELQAELTMSGITGKFL